MSPTSETTLRLSVSDGEANAKLFVPSTAPPSGGHPLVVMYSDAFGLRPELSSLGAHLAAQGYAVLQPDPFWRLAPYPPFDPKTTFGDPAEKERLFALLAKASFDQTLLDTQALVASLASDGRIATEQIATMGYCMGGRFALLSAIHWPQKVVAAASIHGGGLVTAKPNSPHLALSSVRATLYFAVADNDASCTPEMQNTLRQALEAVGVKYELEGYPDALHGFGVPGTAVYNEAATAHYWEKTISLFSRAFQR